MRFLDVQGIFALAITLTEQGPPVQAVVILIRILQAPHGLKVLHSIGRHLQHSAVIIKIP